MIGTAAAMGGGTDAVCGGTYGGRPRKPPVGPLITARTAAGEKCMAAWKVQARTSLRGRGIREIGAPRESTRRKHTPQFAFG